MKKFKCWWCYFHNWDKWEKIDVIFNEKRTVTMQNRRCIDCGRYQRIRL